MIICYNTNDFVYIVQSKEIVITAKNKQVRNDDITSDPVRLIDENGKQVGVIPLQEALDMANQKQLDLVEVSQDTTPAVCKLIDYDKLRYQKKIQRQKSKKNAHRQEIKEIRLTPNTGQHDIEFKVKQARKFLEKKDKVKIQIRFVGREKAHPEIGQQLMDDIIKELSDISEIDSPMKWEQNRLVSILKPIG